MASYTLRASLDTTKHTVTGTGTIVWRNASRAPADEIWVHLYLNAFKSDRTLFMRFPDGSRSAARARPSEWGSITVDRLALEGGADLWPGAEKTSPGDPDDETDIRVPLPAPVAPGAEIRLDVAFTSHLPALLFRTGWQDGFYMVGQWFPKIARREPDGRWAHFAFHHLSEFYADFGAYDVTVDTPAAMVVGATGTLAGEVRTGDRIARRFVQDSVHDFAFTAWSKFQELTADRRGRRGRARALSPRLRPRRRRGARRRAPRARVPGRGLRALPLPDAHRRPPARRCRGGGGDGVPDAHHHRRQLVPALDGHPRRRRRHRPRARAPVVLRPRGHGRARLPLPRRGPQLVRRGARAGGRARAGLGALGPRALGLARRGPTASAAADAARNAPVAQGAADFVSGRDYGALVYNRTATIFATLANVYGEAPLRRALGRYTRRHRFRHPGPDDLLQAVREVVGDDAATQLRAALFDRATVDYSVDAFDSTADEAPGKGFHGQVLVRRRGALRFPVDVDLLGEDGTTQRVRWDAVESARWLPYQGASALAGAVIDPDHRVLLDDDLGNNAQSSHASRLSGALLDRLTFAAEAVLTGLLP